MKIIEVIKVKYDKFTNSEKRIRVGAVSSKFSQMLYADLLPFLKNLN